MTHATGAAPAAAVPETLLTRPLIDVVVVSYRSQDLLRACLASLAAFPPRTGDLAVHVVDNDSRDGTAEMLARDFPSVRRHILSRNVGFSTANNVALAIGRAPYALVLNPDTELRPGTLDHLLAVLESEPRVGMVGPRLELADGTFDHAAKRSFPTPLAALAHFTGVGRRAGARVQLAQYRAPAVGEREVGDVDAINGAFMLVRREALEQVGLFDPGYWLYMEDLDWCYRFHEHGWRVLYDGRVSALHIKGGATGKRRPFRQNVAFHRGMGRFYRKFNAGRRPALDAAVYTAIVAKATYSISRNAVASAIEGARGGR